MFRNLALALSILSVHPIPAVPVDAPWWFNRHAAYSRQAHEGQTKILFLGDSITDMWRNEGQKIWRRKFARLGATNFGIGGDKVENVLWRVHNGELDGMTPRVVILLIGTNNLPNNTVDEILATHVELLNELRHRLPKTKIQVFGVFPRVDAWSEGFREKIAPLNSGLAALADGKQVFFTDIGDRFKSPGGGVSKKIMHDGLHLTEAGYRIWADAIR